MKNQNSFYDGYKLSLADNQIWNCDASNEELTVGPLGSCLPRGSLEMKKLMQKNSRYESAY